MNIKPRKPRRWLYPAGVERDYVRRLVEIAERCTAVIEETLLPALRLRADASNWPDVPIDASSDWHRVVVSAIETMTAAGTLSDQALSEIVLQYGDRTVTFNGQQLQAVLRSVYGVNVIAAEPDLRPILEVWEAENIRLIKSIPTQYAEQLQGRVVSAVQKGTTLRDMVKEVRASYDLPRNRAELIATDQIGKLNGQLTQARQQAIGVEEYRWRGVLDGRERAEHVAREGKVFRWDRPPEDGNPGQPIRCRCSAEGIYPDFEDLRSLFAYN